MPKPKVRPKKKGASLRNRASTATLLTVLRMGEPQVTSPAGNAKMIKHSVKTLKRINSLNVEKAYIRSKRKYKKGRKPPNSKTEQPLLKRSKRVTHFAKATKKTPIIKGKKRFRPQLARRTV